MIRRFAVPVIALSLLVPMGLASPVQAKQTKKVACVKKKTGKMRLVKAKRKCPKGWKRIEWNKKGQTGQEGDRGPDASLGTVVDGNGATVGELTGLSEYTRWAVSYTVAIGGGLYAYDLNGRLLANEGVAYKRTDCKGSGYLLVGGISEFEQILLKSPELRVVGNRSERSTAKPRVYRVPGTSREVADTKYFYVNDDDECVSAGIVSGVELDLVPVRGVGDVPGPLRIR